MGRNRVVSRWKDGMRREFGVVDDESHGRVARKE